MTTGAAGRAEGLAAFENEIYADFSIPEKRAAMELALAEVRVQFGREYSLLIGGERVWAAAKLQSLNPSHPAEIVGIHQRATLELARRAVEEAHAFFPQWSSTPPAERVSMLLRAAAILRRRKMECERRILGDRLGRQEKEQGEAEAAQADGRPRRAHLDGGSAQPSGSWMSQAERRAACFFHMRCRPRAVP